jgi:hypothetical protein
MSLWYVFNIAGAIIFISPFLLLAYGRFVRQPPKMPIDTVIWAVVEIVLLAGGTAAALWFGATFGMAIGWGLNACLAGGIFKILSESGALDRFF